MRRAYVYYAAVREIIYKQDKELVKRAYVYCAAI